jgi:transposase
LLQAIAAGTSQRAVAREFRVSLATVQHWVRVTTHAPPKTAQDCVDRLRGPKQCPNLTPEAITREILTCRQQLAQGPLGEVGARTIRAALQENQPEKVWPSVRTIGRVLQRSGVLDGQPRIRRPAPRPGWYLAAVAARRAEVDCFDGVEGLRIASGPRVEVLNAISLLGGLPGSWPHPVLLTDLVLENLIEHWQAHDLPHFAQFDNDTLFQGPHQYTDAVGRVVRLCLQLAVTPVFTPPRETGFQAAIENYNGRWQTKVWSRFQHQDLAQVRARSNAYVQALRVRVAERIEQAPPRRPWPRAFQFDPSAPPQGSIIYLRRTNPAGQAVVLGHSFLVDPHWQNRLVRAEVDFAAANITFFALRRRAPADQPLLATHPYHFPTKARKRARAPKDLAHTCLPKRPAHKAKR